MLMLMPYVQLYKYEKFFGPGVYARVEKVTTEAYWQK
jgi:hypothetical protein